MSEVINQRFRVESQLGRGTVGDVYRVVDGASGADQPPVLALKRITQPLERLSCGNGTPTLATFVSIFSQLTELHHPYLLPVCHYGLEQQGQRVVPYYTMPLLHSPLSLSDAARSLPLEGRLKLVADVLSVLVYLHRRGILHRNLKPENVFVVDGAVRVSGVGLGLMVQPDHLDRMTSASLSHLAPELLEGRPASVQADLYCLGLLMFEVLGGRFPYQRSNTRELITNIQHFVADAATVGIPTPLASIVNRLISKDPTVRYQSALDALGAIEAVVGRPLRLVGTAFNTPYLPSTAIAGRDAELSQIDAALQNAAQGFGGVLIFTGDRGIGKTRLLREAHQRALLLGADVLDSNPGNNGSYPFQLWRPFARRLAQLPDASEHDREVLQLLAGDATNPDAMTDPATLAATIAGLLASATRVKPLVLLYDDLHRAGMDSLWLLEQVIQLSGDYRLVVIGAAETDENKPFTLPGTVALRRLSVRYISALSQTVLGQAGELPIVNALLYRETDGNPFFLVEVMRALAEQAGDLAQIGIKTLPDQLFAEGLQEALSRRIDLLSEDEQRLLAALSLDGASIEPSVLMGLTDPLTRDQWLLNAHEASILDGEGGQWVFSHALLLDSFIALLNDTQREGFHLQIATLLDTPNADPTRIAYHFEQAGHEDLAYPFALKAAQKAFNSGAAEFVIDRLERWLPAAVSPADRVLMLLMLGDAYAQTGDAERSERNMLEALKRVTQPSERGRALLGLANVARQRGDDEQSQKHLMEASTLAHVPTQALALLGLGNLMGEMGDVDAAVRYSEQALNSGGLTRVQRMRTLQAVGMTYADLNDLPQAVTRLGQAYEMAIRDDYREQARVLSSLAGLYFMHGGYEQARGLFVHRLALALERNDTPNVARAVGNIGYADARIGQGGAAERLLKLALSIAQVIQAPALEVGLAFNLGVYYTDAVLMPEALEQFNRAAEAASDSGMTSLNDQIALYRAYIHQSLGQLTVQQAIQQVQTIREASEVEGTRVAADYWTWKIDPTQREAARRASDYYQQMHSIAPDAELAARYHEMTGKTLPLPVLPALPASITQRAVNPDALIQQAQSLVK